MTITITIPGRKQANELPPLLRDVSRAAVRDGDAGGADFLPPGYLRPTGSYDTSGAARDVDGTLPGARQQLAAEELVLLELADGSQFLTSAGRLQQTLKRLHPELLGADDRVLFDKLLPETDARTRDFGGAVGGIVRRVYTFVAGEATDAIAELAIGQLRSLNIDAAELSVSWAGTKALMWAIESTLLKEPGLYAWTGTRGQRSDLVKPDAQRLEKAAVDKAPLLVFVHGTASSTLGSFGELAVGDSEVWSELNKRFHGGIYALEHRTLSESPIDNAIALVEALPAGAHVSFVSHSRGGLVVDLICADGFDGHIESFRRAANLPGLGDRDPDSADSRAIVQQLDDAHARHREQLLKLADALQKKQLVVERYLRTACPASGTRLASGNFDLFLSGLLTLVGAVPFLFASPWYAALKRVAIEIAKNRTDPHLVPGIEAQLPDSPMATFLRRLKARPGLVMAVIAGDIEPARDKHLLKRLGVLLTDTLIFEGDDHDLVVNTTAMLAGIAPAAGARVLFDRAADATHFRYFANIGTRSALRDWLVAEAPEKVAAFRALPGPGEYAAALAAAARAASATGAAADVQRPVVVVLPGVMGSHLRVGGSDRVWLDVFDIARGGLGKIGWDKPGVEADGLFDMSYGKLCLALAKSHRVERFAYDWRQPLDVLAERLGEFLDQLLKQTEQPVRLLAHSMGGLVVRACIHKRRAVMDALMARPGARLVMAGTPNQGAHSMVENLIGKGDTLRMLVRLDVKQTMQQVLDLVGGFRGALQLLPKRGFVDTFQGQPGGGEPHDYRAEQTWVGFKPLVKDFWFGNGTVATLPQHVLDAGSWLWEQDGIERPALPAAYEKNSAYVFGVAKNTPCGIRVDGGRLKMVGTPLGDGTVTWQSGRIGGIGQFYYMTAAHGDLLSSEAHFDALVELLATGATAGLSQTPPTSREVQSPRPVTYDAGPPSEATADEAERLLLGGTLAPRVPAGRLRRLQVTVHARDLRFIDKPIMVGHYEHDPIAGAERLIDRELLNGDLSERQRLGLYAGPLGTATVVLRVSNEAERLRGSLRGAVIAGLGSYDTPLDMARLTDAVRNGALRYLLQVVDVLGTDERELSLASVLMGYNSSANLTVESSVEALVRGVMEANARFHETTRSKIRITRLHIVELYMDTAITAVYALQSVAGRLARLAAQQKTELICDPELQQGDGRRQRLFDSRSDSYWPRLIVTSALDDADGSGAAPRGAEPATAIAGTLRYVFVGQRARAETVQRQRQPGLVERLVRQQITSTVWSADFGRTLFQLMVPHDFKEAARQLQQVVMVVDAGTANLPWELMLADDLAAAGEDRVPMAIKTRFIRQLSGQPFRRQVRQATGRRALVVGDPSVQGFGAAFTPAGEEPRADPAQLPGARDEAEAIARQLRGQGYDVEPLVARQNAAQVLSALYQQPWRILHISAHGIFGLPHVDGRQRSGVVLSDGLLITAAEIDAMELVPELVFLNCCHLGTVDLGGGGNRLAASVAGELIAIGVRCVVVAGWAVDDELARLFGETFYDALLRERQPFGQAVWTARRATHEKDAANITWGAFQAYGDPDWRVEPRASRAAVASDRKFASPDELLDALAAWRVELAKRSDRVGAADSASQVRRLDELVKGRCRPAWLQLAEVQSALGATWYDLGQFAKAREQLLAAVRADDRFGRVPLRDVEKLANAEARLGEETGDLLMIHGAIQRLAGIDLLMAPVSAADAGNSADERRHAERLALRGGAHKRMASVAAGLLLKAHAASEPLADGLHDEVLSVLRDGLANSGAAYAEAESGAAADQPVPYLTLNRLALDALVEQTPDARRQRIALAQHCARQANVAFGAEPDFWNAVMGPEALLVERLLDRALFKAGAAGEAALEEVGQAYAAALRDVASKPGQLNSAVTQLEVLASLLKALALATPGNGNARAADRLMALLARLQPQRALPAWLKAPLGGAGKGTR